MNRKCSTVTDMFRPGVLKTKHKPQPIDNVYLAILFITLLNAKNGLRLEVAESRPYKKEG